MKKRGRTPESESGEIKKPMQLRVTPECFDACNCAVEEQNKGAGKPISRNKWVEEAIWERVKGDW